MVFFFFGIGMKRRLMNVYEDGGEDVNKRSVFKINHTDPELERLFYNVMG